MKLPATHLSGTPARANHLRILTPTSTARVLRSHLARHNLRIAFLALLTTLLAIALWILLYGVAYWLILLSASAAGFSEARIPESFLHWFIVLALVSVLAAWISSRFLPSQMPRDKKTAQEVASDFLLAIPRITLSLFSTISAWRRLTPAEFDQAASFIHRLAAEKRMPLPSVPQEIPDEHSRERVLLTLQIMQIIDLRKRDRDWFVTLHISRPRAFRFGELAAECD